MSAAPPAWSVDAERVVRGIAAVEKSTDKVWSNTVMLAALATIRRERGARRVFTVLTFVMLTGAAALTFIATRDCAPVVDPDHAPPLFGSGEWDHHHPVASFPARPGGTCSWVLPDGRMVYWSAGEDLGGPRFCYWPPDTMPRVQVRRAPSSMVHLP